MTSEAAARRMWVWVAVVGLVVNGAAVVLAAGDVRITPVVAEDRVFANFAAPGAFSDDVRAAVQSGLPVTISYVTELRRNSSLWFDETIASTEVASSVKFDTLTGVYQVSKSRNGTVHWSETTVKEDEMRLWVTEFERVLLTDTSRLRNTGDYYVRVRARDNLPRGFSLWPWGRSDTSGRVELPVIR